jgi:CBS domain-containing protein
MYRVKDVMTDDVVTCEAGDSLESAVQIMRDRGCGCVPVVDGAMRVAGLVTDRDAVMCALRNRQALHDLQVADACSRPVICCEAEDTLERAEVLMRVNHVRRLAVVRHDRVLVGLLSLTDLARHVEPAAEGSPGLSPRHITMVLAATSGVPPPFGEDRRGSGEKSGPQPIIEAFFHG